MRAPQRPLLSSLDHVREVLGDRKGDYNTIRLPSAPRVWLPAIYAALRASGMQRDETLKLLRLRTWISRTTEPTILK